MRGAGAQPQLCVFLENVRPNTLVPKYSITLGTSVTAGDTSPSRALHYKRSHWRPFFPTLVAITAGALIQTASSGAAVRSALYGLGTPAGIAYDVYNGGNALIGAVQAANGLRTVASATASGVSDALGYVTTGYQRTRDYLARADRPASAARAISDRPYVSNDSVVDRLRSRFRPTELRANAAALAREIFGSGSSAPVVSRRTRGRIFRLGRLRRGRSFFRGRSLRHRFSYRRVHRRRRA